MLKNSKNILLFLLKSTDGCFWKGICLFLSQKRNENFFGVKGLTEWKIGVRITIVFWKCNKYVTFVIEKN